MSSVANRSPRSTFSLFASAIFLSLCPFQLNFAQETPKTDPEVIALELNKPIERELEGGQKHSYRFELAAGEYIHIRFRQISTNVRLSMSLPGGGRANFIDIPIKAPEVGVEYVAFAPGSFVLDVVGSRLIPKGRYEVFVDQLRPATDKERLLQESKNHLREAFAFHNKGKYDEARALLKRCLDIQERIFGKESPSLVTVLDYLAANYLTTSEFAEAERVYLRAIEILEKSHGPSSTELALRLTQLGYAYQKKNDIERATDTFRRALAIYERSPDNQTYMVATLRGLLGEIAWLQDDYAVATSHFQRSRSEFEKLFGPEHMHVEPAIVYLGLIAYESGDYATAEVLLRKALAIREKTYGADDIRVSSRLSFLAQVLTTAGNHTAAEQLYRRALAAYEKTGSLHKELPEVLFGLARLYWAQGRVDEAVKAETRASDTEDRIIDINLAVGSDSERFAVLSGLSHHSWRNISLNVDLAPNDEAARDLAVLTILRRKGRVQDSMANSMAALHNHLGNESRSLADEYEEVTSKLAKLILEGPGTKPSAEYLKQVKDLEERQRKIEDEIGRASSGSFLNSKSISLEAVRAAIPDGTALVEYGVYHPFDPKVPDNSRAYGEPRYVAYVIDKKGVRRADLGAAAEIDSAVGAMRQALRDPKRSDFQKVARAADEKIMEPVRRLIGDAERLLISPDGDLNLIPFEALVDERNGYLLERFSVSYLTSGRDLLRAKGRRSAVGKPLIVADPDFGDSSLPAGDSRRVSRTSGRRSVTSTRDLSDTYFAPLTGTAREARSILSLFPDANILTGEKASETMLKKMQAPGILHIATHGFFLEYDAGERRALPKYDAEGRALSKTAFNPMLRSGLALAGANRRTGDDDGILTALEASALDLWGTRLVVLSACDTGLGEVRNGEGVYGLRRAFFLAGAESLLMSLWPVSDYVTRELMTGYYKNLRQGIGRGESLRRVQLEMLKRPNRRHPFYWASFIQSGEWGDLDGER